MGTHSVLTSSLMSMEVFTKVFVEIYESAKHLSLRHNTIQGKTKDFSTFAGTWTALEKIMLSEISPAEKENYHKVSLIYGT